MTTELKTVQDVTAYVRERPFICNQLEIMIGDKKSPAAILGWLHKGVKDAGDKADLKALMAWLERHYPQAWPPRAPDGATEWIEI